MDLPNVQQARCYWLRSFTALHLQRKLGGGVCSRQPARLLLTLQMMAMSITAIYICAGGAQQLAMRAGQQAGGKENLVQDAAAIASAALKLQPLLAKAAQLRRKHESRALAGAMGATGETLGGCKAHEIARATDGSWCLAEMPLPLCAGCHARPSTSPMLPLQVM